MLPTDSRLPTNRTNALLFIPSQVAARELVVEQDRAYEQAVRQDQRQNLSAVENTPAQVTDLADEEPSSEEMRRARLLRFGLPPR